MLEHSGGRQVEALDKEQAEHGKRSGSAVDLSTNKQANEECKDAVRTVRRRRESRKSGTDLHFMHDKAPNNTATHQNQDKCYCQARSHSSIILDAGDHDDERCDEHDRVDQRHMQHVRQGLVQDAQVFAKCAQHFLRRGP